MTTDYTHGWNPPTTVEQSQSQINESADELFRYMNGHLSRYRQERDAARSQLEEANKNIDQYEEQVTKLNLDLNIARAGHTLAAPTSKGVQQQNFRSEKFPDPEKFDGTRLKLPGFLIQLQMKLEINDDRFRNEASKVIYSVSRLEGRALDQVVPLVSINPTAPFSNVEEFVAYLQSSFGDPDPRGTARRELISLKQGKGDFATYYSEFLRLMAYLEYNESAKIDALREGLSEELKDALTFRTDLPNSTEAFASMLMIIDNQVRGRKADKTVRNNLSQSQTSHITTHPSHVPGGLAPMDLSASQYMMAVRPTPENRYTFINGQRKTTVAEKHWRRQNNLCLYCASSGHGFSSCPSMNKSKGAQPTLTAAATTHQIQHSDYGSVTDFQQTQI